MSVEKYSATVRKNSPTLGEKFHSVKNCIFCVQRNISEKFLKQFKILCELSVEVEVFWKSCQNGILPVQSNTLETKIGKKTTKL